MLSNLFRFSTVFSSDKDSMPRVWTGKEDIRMITKDARAAVSGILQKILIYAPANLSTSTLQNLNSHIGPLETYNPCELEDSTT